MVCNGDKMFYESFDDLTDDLKEKFKVTTTTDNEKTYRMIMTRAKKGYVEFINQLNTNGDVLLSDYKGVKNKVNIKWCECGHTTSIRPGNYKNGDRCSICCGLQVVRGINDIATTDPYLVKYFVNVEDAYTHTRGSSDKVQLKCPYCNTVKQKKVIVDNLVKQGFSCDACGDGIPSGERFMYYILKDLGLNFKVQFTYDKKHKYDFMVNGIIVELHGKQHYKDVQGWSTYEQQHENDMYKYDLAVLNGHEYGKTYFVIDCKESDFDLIQDRIIKSNLLQQLGYDYKDVNWNKCKQNSCSSFVKVVCDYYNKNGGTTGEIAKVFGFTYVTIGAWLKQGSKIGLCDYNSIKAKEQVMTQVHSKMKIKIVAIHKKTNEVIYFDSMMDATRWLNKKECSSISECCSGKRKTAYGYKWMYYEDYLKLDENSDSNSNVA